MYGLVRFARCDFSRNLALLVSKPFAKLPIFFSQVSLLVGLSGLEPPTSRLSGVRSNRLSYKPIWSSAVQLSLTALGGDKRDRTVDLLLAKQALSQLSYTPIFW